jgi:hypothetical protein
MASPLCALCVLRSEKERISLVERAEDNENEKNVQEFYSSTTFLCVLKTYTIKFFFASIVSLEKEKRLPFDASLLLLSSPIDRCVCIGKKSIIYYCYDCAEWRIEREKYKWP